MYNCKEQKKQLNYFTQLLLLPIKSVREAMYFLTRVNVFIFMATKLFIQPGVQKKSKKKMKIYINNLKMKL